MPIGIRRKEYDAGGTEQDLIGKDAERVRSTYPGVRGQGMCNVCGGTGSRKVARLNTGSQTIRCTSCNGSGKCKECLGVKTLKRPCSVCNGKGSILSKSKTQEVFNSLYAQSEFPQ